jgi:hypothetical protein
MLLVKISFRVDFSTRYPVTRTGSEYSVAPEWFMQGKGGKFAAGLRTGRFMARYAQARLKQSGRTA